MKKMFISLVCASCFALVSCCNTCGKNNVAANTDSKQTNACNCGSSCACSNGLQQDNCGCGTGCGCGGKGK